jgi:hypothetical protein
MKTIKEWLEELPEPYRSQALENTGDSDGEMEVKSLVTALECAFLWISSSQGYHYWSQLSKTL